MTKRRSAYGVILLVIITVGVIVCWSPWRRTRQMSLAARVPPDPLLQSLLAAIKPGMSQQQAAKVIDQQRQGRRWNDSTEIYVEHAVERKMTGGGDYLWLEYKPLAFPSKLGPSDKVSAVRAFDFNDLQDQVPAGLFPAVKLIHQSPGVEWNNFDPSTLIRAVNGLYALGQGKAVTAMEAYMSLAHTADGEYYLDEQRIFLILRLLFVNRNGDPEMPWMGLGAPGPGDVQPGDKDFPLYPLVVQDDIPFCIVGGYMLGGMPESPAAHLDYCRKNCILRSAPLHPAGSPLNAVEAICNSDAWRRVFGKVYTAADAQFAVRLQALRSVANIFGTVPEDLTARFQWITPRRFEKNWKSCLEDERLRNSTW